ncbi:epoxide hydrolase [Achlya hypogyna]|uniref:Epoxide hydrolase n=1 Tax=Achlya hypogyna TaxID=1202772 RepID=A0A1V9YGZ2_ACHHY|nr:epoxide hydrolase [Achlya hypogyna]
MASPNDPSYNHLYVNLEEGLRLHYVDVGPCDGIPLLLLHGWPDLWWGWRHQIQYLRQTYRVIVPDQPGFGATTSPTSPAFYRRKNLAAIYAKFLDYLKIDKAIVIGHDWGGNMAWAMALFQPDRVLAVGAVCTPYFPLAPQKLTLETMVKLQPTLTYQLYLVQDETPSHFEAAIEKFFKLIFQFPATVRPSDAKDLKSMMERFAEFEYDPATSRRGFTDSDLAFLIDEYERQGFATGLNWYKTVELDYDDKVGKDLTLHHEALFIGATRDMALPPSMSTGMEKIVPNLSRGLVDNAGHWVLWEAPDEVNQILGDWLEKTVDKLGLKGP